MARTEDIDTIRRTLLEAESAYYELLEEEEPYPSSMQGSPVRRTRDGSLVYDSGRWGDTPLAHNDQYQFALRRAKEKVELLRQKLAHAEGASATEQNHKGQPDIIGGQSLVHTATRRENRRYLACAVVKKLYNIQTFQLIERFPRGLQPYQPSGAPLPPPRQHHKHKLATDEYHKLRNYIGFYIDEDGTETSRVHESLKARERLEADDPEGASHLEPDLEFLQRHVAQLEEDLSSAKEECKRLYLQDPEFQSWEYFVWPNTEEERQSICASVEQCRFEEEDLSRFFPSPPEPEFREGFHRKALGRARKLEKEIPTIEALKAETPTEWEKRTTLLEAKRKEYRELQELLGDLLVEDCSHTGDSQDQRLATIDSKGCINGGKMQSALPFPCNDAVKWEDVSFVLKSDTLVYVKTPKGEARVEYNMLEFVDRRSGDKPNETTWPLFQAFARLNGEISKESQHYIRNISDRASDLNTHLKRIFGIKESIYTGHYKKEWKYKTRFKIRDDRIPL